METNNTYSRELDGYDVPCLVKKTSTMKYPKTLPDCFRINAYNMKRMNCFMYDNRRVTNAHGDFVIQVEMSAGREIHTARKQYINFESKFDALRTVNIAAGAAAERHGFDHEDHKEWLHEVKDHMKSVVIAQSKEERYENRTKKTVKPVFYTGFMKCDIETAPWFASLIIMNETNSKPKLIAYYFKDTWFGTGFENGFAINLPKKLESQADYDAWCKKQKEKVEEKISSFCIDLHAGKIMTFGDVKNIKWFKGQIVEDDFADDDFDDEFVDAEVEEIERFRTMQKYKKTEIKKGGQGKKVDMKAEIAQTKAIYVEIDKEDARKASRNVVIEIDKPRYKSFADSAGDMCDIDQEALDYIYH